jgi:tetratricopeptide (TPR) repeat protein
VKRTLGLCLIAVSGLAIVRGRQIGTSEVNLPNSTNGIVYEAIQRTFRNAIVNLLRQRIPESYPNDFEEIIRSRFSSWEEIVAAAESSKSTGVISPQHSDVFSYLDVSHFAVLFDKHFAILAPIDGLPQEVASNLKRQVLSYIREIKTARDPISHPTDADIDAFDALRAVDNAIRVLRVLRLPESANEIEQWRSQAAAMASSVGFAKQESGPLVSDTLPPRDSIVVDFVGRQDILQDLWSWLADPKGKRWLLCGEGGTGKSALAFHFASEVAGTHSTDICGVYWLSAKKRKYEQGEVVDIKSPDFWDLDSAVNKLLTDYGWSEHVDKPLETKQLLLLELFKEFPSLLIVDDVDSIAPEAEEAVEFLASTACVAGAKVLLTSRRGVLGTGSASSEISGLPDDEAEAFIDARAERFELDKSRISAKQRKKIISLCEGYPLYMEDLLRLCTFLSVQNALESWEHYAGDNVRRYALQREMEMLSNSARSVLEACSVRSGAVTALELQRVLSFGEEIIVSALDELRRNFLVPAPNLLEGIPRFQVNSNLASLVRKNLDSQRLRELETAVAAVTGQEMAKSNRAIDDYLRQAEVLRGAGQLEKSEETLQVGLKLHPNRPQLFSALGVLYSKWDPVRKTDARNAWKRASELGIRDRRMYLNWILLESRAQEWQKAVSVASNGLERLECEDAALLQQAGYCSSRLAQSLAAGLHTQKAQQEFEKSDEFIRRAVRAGRAQGVERYFISRTYRTWVLNAEIEIRIQESLGQEPRRQLGALRSRLSEWLEWDPSDASALEELRRQSARCPELVDQYADAH